MKVSAESIVGIPAILAILGFVADCGLGLRPRSAAGRCRDISRRLGKQADPYSNRWL